MFILEQYKNIMDYSNIYVSKCLKAFAYFFIYIIDIIYIYIYMSEVRHKKVYIYGH